jgi:hypothetical protein
MDNNFKSKIRSLKVSLVNGDISTNIKEERASQIKKELDVLDKKLDDYILTGSAVLFLMGWLDRTPNDYDVIVPTSEANKHKRDINNTDTLYSVHDKLSEKRLGVILEPMSDENYTKPSKIYNSFGVVGKLFGGIIDMFSDVKSPNNLTIDVFLNDEAPYETVLIGDKKVKIDSPINILNIKSELNNLKSDNDIYNIFTKLCK